MGEIVNLRRVKKARLKAEAEDQAATNRARHGRTRAERDADAAQGRQRARALDAAKLESPDK